MQSESLTYALWIVNDMLHRYLYLYLYKYKFWKKEHCKVIQMMEREYNYLHLVNSI